MGLIKAALNSVTGTMADQWKEFFLCEAMTISLQVDLESQWQTDSVL